MGGEFVIELEDDAEVVANPTRLVRALENLLENALQHSPPNAKATIRLSRSGEMNMVRLDILDQGPGYPPEHMLHLLQQRSFCIGQPPALRRAEHTGGRPAMGATANAQGPAEAAYRATGSIVCVGPRLADSQGVSSDSDALVAAANALVAQPDSLTSSVRQHQNDVDRITLLPQASGMNSDPAFPTGPSEPGNVYARLLLALDKMDNAATERRIGLTLQALEAIGHTMSAYPGRKNLIWVTSGIPFQILPSMGLSAKLTTKSSDYTREIARTASVLADTQMAVYPVDVKGLPTTGLTAADVAVGARGDFTGVVADRQKNQTFGIWNSRDSMKNLAHETGGRAFTGSNDLSAAIGESMEEGSHYYTLAYVPANRKNDGLYRNIKVTSERSGLELAYRRGYFATEDSAPSGDEAAKTLAASLQPGMPPATSILMKVRVLPPDAAHKATRIDYAVETGDVQIQESPDHTRHSTLDFMAVAWDSEGRVAGSASDTLSPTLKPEFNMASLNAGIPANQELTLKPGKYVLSLGVMDRNSRKVGTGWASLTIPDAGSK